jgi:hypothetical protein
MMARIDSVRVFEIANPWTFTRHVAHRQTVGVLIVTVVFWQPPEKI